MPYYIKKDSVKKKPRKSGTRTLVNKLDKIFSLYIRLRDSKQFGYKAFKCISCGQIKPFAKADCGHYYSRSKMSTRYDEDNCNSECNFCNRFKSDHLDGYRENLIRKIGQSRFDLLRSHSNQVKKWSEFELQQLIKYYSALVDKMLEEK